MLEGLGWTLNSEQKKKNREIITIFIHKFIVHLSHLNVTKSNMTFSMTMVKLRIAYAKDNSEMVWFECIFDCPTALSVELHSDGVRVK